MTAPIELLEREDELATIEATLEAALEGKGGLVVIEGEAGAGKTSLLDAATETATGRGMLVPRARGGEYERDFPYGVIRQLLEPQLADATRRTELLSGTAATAAPIFAPGTARSELADPLGVQHGLYWLLVDLAARAPLAILVDDVQWADLVSLRALLYCARRLEGLPIALGLAIRTGEPDAPEGLLAELRGEPIARQIVPPPLSAAAAGRLIAAGAGRRPTRRFAEACRHATGGNPLFLGELLRGLEAEGADLADEDADRLTTAAAAGVGGSILVRLDRMGDDSIEVARAVAVLEPNAEARAVSALAGLPPTDVVAACERLIGAHMLFDARPLGFVHPVVRAAVLSDIPEPRLALAHARAARLLSDAGATGDAVAAHLLLSESDGDLCAVETLRTAASVAIARGVPDTAVRYLRRSLLEPPAPDDRSALEGELGFALIRASDPEGIEVLRAVQSTIADPVSRAEIAIILSNSLSLRGGATEAASVLEESLAEIGDPASPLGMQLRARLLQLPVLGLERVPEGALPGPGEELSPDTLDGRALMQQTSLLLAFGLGPMQRGRELAEAAVADMDAVERDAVAGFPPQAVAVALALADRGELTDDLCAVGLEAARRRGALPGIPGNHGIRGLCRVLDGDLHEGQADAEIAVRMLGPWELDATRLIHLSTLVRTLVARGDLAAAGDALGDFQSGSGPHSGGPGALLFCARGEFHQAGGRHAEARDDYLEAARMLRWVPATNPEILPWRTGLAQCEVALGNQVEGRRLATEAVEHAREAGGRRGLGVALCALGTVSTGAEQIEILREAVDELSGSRATLQRARALVELGAALRRGNHRKEAREPLREGLDLAHRCDAGPLEERARAELAATGARPRSAMLSGVESLTPSERRVAGMAAEGMTNREIAQGLFVSAKTVETHLRHVYQKLDISRRTELAAALGNPTIRR